MHSVKGFRSFIGQLEAKGVDLSHVKIAKSVLVSIDHISGCEPLELTVFSVAVGVSQPFMCAAAYNDQYSPFSSDSRNIPK